MRAFLALLIVIGLMVPALAQHQPTSPYAGLETRVIKALSEAQISDLRSGRGAGLALAAELNGYPGPVHVLELADALHLTPDQRRTMERLVAAMRSETIPLGEKLIEQEVVLDHQFSAKTISEASLMDLTREIGDTQGALRAAHLRYHLATLQALTSVQVTRYAELRGYASGPDQHQHKAH